MVTSDALAEEIDAGAKNCIDCSLENLKAYNTTGTWNNNVYIVSGVGTVTVNSDSTVTIVKTGTSANLNFFITHPSTAAIAGDKYAGYILSGCPSGGSTTTYRLRGEQASQPYGEVCNDNGDGAVIPYSSVKVLFYINCQSSYTTNGLTFKPMICTKAAFAVSNKFVPYRPDYQTLVDKTTEQTFGIFKYNNNYTITAITRECNGFAWFTLTVTSTANIAANTNTIIGYVDSNVQPAGASTDKIIFTARVNTDPPSLVHSHIRGSDGYIYINSPTAIPAGTSISITGSYKI